MLLNILTQFTVLYIITVFILHNMIKSFNKDSWIAFTLDVQM
jgi:hypothetical protein